MRFGATMQVSDEMARRYYNENIEDFRRPERAHVRHILFKTQEKPESEDAKMKALAEDVFKRIKAGASFAAMAKQYSEDPGSKDNGGEYPNITRGQTVKNFEDTSFNAPLKTLVGPIKTEFGYHLMEVLDRQPAQLLSFDQVAEQIKNEIKQQQGADALGRAADNLRRELEKTTEGLQELAAKAAGTVYTLEYKNAQYALPELGIKPELFNRIQTMKKGQVTDPQTLDNRMVLIQIADVLPPRPLTLEEARPQIVSILQNSATQKRVEEARKQADLMVVAGEKDLAKMARELGMPLKKTQLFSRRGFADGIGPAISVESGFSAPIGHVWGPFTVDGGWFVAKVIDKKTADLSQLPARRAEVINQVKSKKANERNDIIEDRLVQKLMDSGRVKINETAKRRLASTGI
jgi:peptidyl-prolyl cis-trans isomerase D